MKSKKRAGFTLIELLVVISIISLLSSVVLATTNTARSKARDARRSADIAQVKIALELYYDDNGRYPPALNESGNPTTRNGGCEAGSCAGEPLVYMTNLSPYITVPADPLYGGTGDGHYQYVRKNLPSGGGDGYGIRINYESIEDYSYCKTGVNMHPGWWGALTSTPICEEVL